MLPVMQRNDLPQRNIQMINSFGFISSEPKNETFNEFFPAETSMKVRQAFATKAKHGEYMGSKAPYGYKKSPDNAHALIIDDETAPIVKRIFEMAAYEGLGFQKIAYRLFDEGVMTPSALKISIKQQLQSKYEVG